MTSFAIALIVLALIPAFMTIVNLPSLREPPQPRRRHRVSVLIPARDEASNIGAALDAVLANTDVDLEVVVLDDHSTDATAEIVAGRAATDPRVRLISGNPLPPGWSGKQFACSQLAAAARHDVLVFVDADVRLSADSVGRMAEFVERRDLGLASGFPRQITGTWSERLIVPLIHVVLLGYLPMAGMRWTRHPGFAAACGQLIVARRDAYLASGGHDAIRASRHDGVTLPRAFRRAGFKTDLFDATELATCRMYQGMTEVWKGFGKNATEGMATPIGLPIWTVLLLGGHVLPVAALVLTLLGYASELMPAAILATGLIFGTRALLALRFRQDPRSVAIAPLGIAALLAIQYDALWRARSGRPAEWRGRLYNPAD